MSFQIIVLDPDQFFSAQWLTQQSCLKKAGVELELQTDVDILLLVEKGIQGGICHEIYGQGTACNIYMKPLIKTKYHHI